MSGPPKTIAATVVGLQRFGGAGTWITLELPQDFTPPRAGQFVQVSCVPEVDFRLNRPFSIAGWERTEQSAKLGILFSVVGEGSAWLDGRQEGDQVEIVGPLGRPFWPIQDRVPILLAGGRGVAPLLYLANQWCEAFPAGRLLYGARDRASLLPTERSPYPVDCSTLDGSSGWKGTVLDLLEKILTEEDLAPERTALFACGPMSMLKEVGRVARIRNLSAQVSLETVFGCGTGLCAGCAIAVTQAEGSSGDGFERYAFACSDGPVFDAMTIDWEEAVE